jgi:hypothetical protein
VYLVLQLREDKSVRENQVQDVGVCPLFLPQNASSSSQQMADYICKNYKQDNGCKFFLWEDDPATQKRMKHGTDLLKSWAVTTPSTRRQLSPIGRTPSTAQHSPQKPAALINYQLSTPQTTPGGKRRFRHLDLEQYNTTPTKTRTPATSRYAIEWLANDDDIEDPESFVTAPGTPQGTSSSPSKQRRTTRVHTSPSKTKQQPAAAVVAYPTLPSFSDAGATTVRDEDIFTTPRAISGGGAVSSRFLGLKPARGSLLGSPGNAMGRPMLAREVLQLLDDNDVRLTDGARMALTDILVVHAKRYEGVVRGCVSDWSISD